VQQQSENRQTPTSAPTKLYKEKRDFWVKRGIRFSKNTWDYFTDQYLSTEISKRPTILPFKLALNIHGMSCFAPGDLFRVSYMPNRYGHFVYFQVMRISHTVGPGDYTTNIDCVMRFRPDKKKTVINEDVLTGKPKLLAPHALKSEFKCKGIDKVLPYLFSIEPTFDNTTIAEYVFRIDILQDGTTNDIYDVTDKSYEYETEDAKATADEVFKTLKDNTPSVCTMNQKISDDGKVCKIYKNYAFSGDPGTGKYQMDDQWWIYIRKGNWFISDKLCQILLYQRFLKR